MRSVHPDDIQHARAAWQTSLESGMPFEVELRIRTTTGSYRWMVARALQISDARSRRVRWAGTWTDIDDLKHLQGELRAAQRDAAESLATLEALQAASPIGFGFVGCELRIVYMNERLSQLNGIPHNEAQGRKIAEVLGPVRPRVENYYRGALEFGESVAVVAVVAVAQPPAS